MNSRYGVSNACAMRKKLKFKILSYSYYLVTDFEARLIDIGDCDMSRSR